MSFLIFFFVITALQFTFASPLSSGDEGDENLFLNSDVSSRPLDASSSSFLLPDDPTLWTATNPDDQSPDNQFLLGDVGSVIIDGTGTEPIGLAGAGDACAADGNIFSLMTGKMRARDQGSSCATNSDANVNLLNLPSWDTVREKFNNLLNPQSDRTPPPEGTLPPEGELGCESNFPEHLCCIATEGRATSDFTATLRIWLNMGGCTRTAFYGLCPL